MTDPRPISELNAKNIIGLFFDIDDTFSTSGKITHEAYSSLWRLKEAGKLVVPVTGRPAGWCDHIARMWPVNAVIGENGALYFMMQNGRLVKKYAAEEDVILSVAKNPVRSRDSSGFARRMTAPHKKQRAEYEKRLAEIRDEILTSVKGTALASDQDYREFDLAIDFCEDVPHIGQAGIDRMVEIAKKHGAIVKVSSIHVNIWFGDHTKLTTTKLFVKNELGMDLDKDNEKFAFAGDSGNDEPMFEYFKNSIGVANVMNFKGRMKTFPTFITKKESGSGFIEVVEKLC